MRGRLHSTDERLIDDDLTELADELSIRLYATMGHRVYLLSRPDIIQLTKSYIDDLHPEDQDAICWLIWDLFQEGMQMEFG
ncbi:MAG TPA: hypothetical protein DEF47_09925 [Herpetosiphon sp.]|uniref:Uncharacterized protein n=2 Tax=Herpetosiphon TaxID=64 RepID=A9AUV4_HERA2|nr:hypothetical protein [Herpetosiphon sp.]ABX06542.1 conserved hypothetical protein [Herpetosiphon aurantiacus DSM 785]MCA0354207.1 hypothetical protein [Chloroflexota bacterium]HBW50210.1 hypothetical protein [Herpetosiphon sp.]